MAEHLINNDSVPNSNHNLSYTQKQIKWRTTAKSELIDTSRINMMKRLTKIVSVVTNYSSLMTDFQIPKSEIRRMFTDVDNAINSWRGVDITSCKKRKKSFKEYKVTATNWFNRNKAKIYGNYFFCPLIFKYILNYCHNISHMNMTDNKRMQLFISIFLNIFDGKITFARTKAQPLLPYQTLIQPNQFRNKCKELILFYDLSWNQKDISPSKIHRIYQKDKFRSNKIFHSFIKCLKNIQLILDSNTHSINKYAFFKPENKINYNSHFLNSNSNPKNEPKNTSVNPSINSNRSPTISCAESSSVTDIRSITNDEMTNYNSDNGLTPQMNKLIQSVLNNDTIPLPAPSNAYNPLPMSLQNNCPFIPLPLQLPNNFNNQMQPFNMNNNIQINNLNVNGNNLFADNNNNNGVSVRYKLLSIHPNLPPIVISQNVV